MLIFLILILFILIFLSSIFFDKIPLFFTMGIYSRESFWEGFNINLNFLIFQISIISFTMKTYNDYLQRKNKINKYLEDLDIYRKYYKKRPYKISFETFIAINALKKLKYNIKDLKGNFFYDGTLEDFIFDNTNFLGCDFEKTIIKDVSFNDCTLGGNSFLSCNINLLRINSSNKIQNMNFNNSIVKNSNFKNISFLKLNLSNSSFNNVTFNSCTLFIKILEKSSFNSCNFNNCNFLKVDGTKVTAVFNSNRFNNCTFEKDFLSNVKNINSKFN